MIFSKWRPTKGGYDYFETKGGNIPLGNDLPTPRLPNGTSIGVASIEAGRAVPAGAKRAGSGELAVGMVAPTKSTALGVVTGSVPEPYAWFAGGLFAAWLIRKYR